MSSLTSSCRQWLHSERWRHHRNVDSCTALQRISLSCTYCLVLIASLEYRVHRHLPLNLNFILIRHNQVVAVNAAISLWKVEFSLQENDAKKSMETMRLILNFHTCWTWWNNLRRLRLVSVILQLDQRFKPECIIDYKPAFIGARFNETKVENVGQASLTYGIQK